MYLFNIFLNDLEIFFNGYPVLFKYADDSTIVSPITSNRDPSADLLGQFLIWCKDNKMVCNPSKCKELVVRKKNHNVLSSPINNIPQCNSFVLLGVTLQSDGKFNEHVRTKNKQDQNILKKLISTDCHPLKDIIPVQKTYVHNLRKKGCVRPKINTERFMNTFVNRLIFKLHLFIYFFKLHLL